MDLKSVMADLESAGTAENVEIYKQQGAGEDVFGVSYTHLKKLKRKLGVDHDLAMELWDTGNSDARSLAMMVADPDEVSPTVATQWMKDVDYAIHGNEVAGVVALSPAGLSKMRQWRKQKSEFARATGYSMLACMLEDDAESVEDLECLRILKDVEMEIHRSPNRARHSMVMAVIAIGVYKPELSEDAIESGERIGDVQVDHGETSFTTPQIAPYINKTLKRTSGHKARVRSC
jgi:3-methyladenine DNA glycosylase AlkD